MADILSSRGGLAQSGAAWSANEDNTSGPPLSAIGILSARAGMAISGAAWSAYENNPSGPSQPPGAQAVLMEGIPPPHAVGQLVVARPQGIQLPGVIGRQAPGIPTIKGGTVALRIFIGGVERTNYLAWMDAAHGQSAGSVGQGAASAQGTTLVSTTRGRWTATFTLFLPTGPGTWGPARGQTVLLTDFGRRLFAGCIIQVDVARQMSTDSAIFFNVTATDKTSICDHRVVTQADYPAGTDVADAFRNIAATFLNGEGISTGALPNSIGTIASDVPLNYTTVTQAFDQLTGLINATWWVDSFSQLQLQLLVNCPACPFSLTETSYNWRNLIVSYQIADYRNVQYVRSNLSTLPSATAQAGITFTYTVNQPLAAARGFSQGACILPSNADSVISLTVNGVAQQFFYGSDPETFDNTNPNFGKVWWMFQGTPYVYPPGSSTLIPNPPNKPHIGDVVVIQYVPSAAQSTGSSITSSSASPLAPVPLPGNTPQNGESFGTCGSGIYENVEQVNDIVLISDLQAIADAMLERYGLPPPVVTFETDAPGAAVGQLISVNIPKSYLPLQQLLITGVQGQGWDSNLLVNDPSLAFDGLGSSFRWLITAGPDIGDWVKWFESLIGRTEHPNPVVRRELPTWILGPGGSVSSGTNSTNPYIVQNSGKLISGYIVAGVPPVNQALVVDILSANLGGKSILGAPFQVGGSDGSLIQTSTFYLDPAYLFVNDVLKIVASYTSIGSNPIPAGSVSVGIVIEW